MLVNYMDLTNYLKVIAIKVYLRKTYMIITFAG